MFELRWLEKEIVKNEGKYFQSEKVKILQYRQLLSTLEYKEDAAVSINKWSEWVDVPIHTETIKELKTK